MYGQNKLQKSDITVHLAFTGTEAQASGGAEILQWQRLCNYLWELNSGWGPWQQEFSTHR